MVGSQVVELRIVIGEIEIRKYLSLLYQYTERSLLQPSEILQHFFNLNGVWASLPSSDFLASLVAAIIMVTYMRRLKKQSVNNKNLNS